jgi:hypothetical protein
VYGEVLEIELSGLSGTASISHLRTVTRTFVPTTHASSWSKHSRECHAKASDGTVRPGLGSEFSSAATASSYVLARGALDVRWIRMRLRSIKSALKGRN